MPHQNVNWPTHTSPFFGGNRGTCPHKVNGKAKDLYSKRRATLGVRGVCVNCVLFCFQGRRDKSHSFICLQFFPYNWTRKVPKGKKKKKKKTVSCERKKGGKIPEHLFQTTVLPNTQTSPRNALLLFWNPTANYGSLIKKEGSGTMSDLVTWTSGNSQGGSKEVMHNPDILPLLL